jgi:hypothetical protein
MALVKRLALLGSPLLDHFLRIIKAKLVKQPTPYSFNDQMNKLRNRDTHVDKKTCCGISNFIQKRNEEKRQVPRLLRKGSMVAN